VLGQVDQQHPARLQASLLAIRSGSIGSTPASEANTTRPSSVTQ
jgi:hypothetical protein